MNKTPIYLNNYNYSELLFKWQSAYAQFTIKNNPLLSDIEIKKLNQIGGHMQTFKIVINSNHKLPKKTIDHFSSMKKIEDLFEEDKQEYESEIPGLIFSNKHNGKGVLLI